MRPGFWLSTWLHVTRNGAGDVALGVPLVAVAAEQPWLFTLATQYEAGPVGGQVTSSIARSSIAASTFEGLSRSAATKRRRTWLVGAATSDTRNWCANHPPEVCGPVGPTTSTVCHVAPSSLESSTVSTSSLWTPGPRSLLYQRQYEITGEVSADRS